MEYTIDATGKKLGRVASEVASILRGKKDVGFAPNKVSDVKVTLENVSKLDISEKRGEAEYKSYSGYPDGLRIESLDHLAGRRGMKEVVMRTIRGMLPRNKLRSLMLKNLTIKD